eukprot:8900254-Pyramimonas_sp.AAC.1
MRPNERGGAGGKHSFESRPTIGKLRSIRQLLIKYPLRKTTGEEVRNGVRGQVSAERPKEASLSAGASLFPPTLSVCCGRSMQGLRSDGNGTTKDMSGNSRHRDKGPFRPRLEPRRKFLQWLLESREKLGD